MIEIYDQDTIHYMAPLCMQDEFYVPETETENEPSDAQDPNSVVDEPSDLTRESSTGFDSTSFTASERESSETEQKSSPGPDSDADQTSEVLPESEPKTESESLPGKDSLPEGLKQRRNVRAQSEMASVDPSVKAAQEQGVKENTP